MTTEEILKKFDLPETRVNWESTNSQQNYTKITYPIL